MGDEARPPTVVEWWGDADSYGLPPERVDRARPMGGVASRALARARIATAGEVHRVGVEEWWNATDPSR